MWRKIFFFCRVTGQIRCGSILFEVSALRRIRRKHARAHTHTHTHTHTQRTSDYFVAAATTYTKQTHTQIQETNIHALSGIRNLDPSNRVEADYTLHCTATVYPLLDAFAKMRKFIISFVMSVCPSAWSYSSFHWKDLHKPWYLFSFRKLVKKIRVPLKSDKNNDYRASARMYINH